MGSMGPGIFETDAALDERFDSLRPKPGHKRARRVELVKLLARYRRIAE